VSPPPDRPLKLGELLAETVRLYGDRIWAALGLGAFVGCGLLVTAATPEFVDILVFALVFTGAYAAAARLVTGDGFSEAWAQVAVRIPILLVLTVIVSIPFALALSQLLLLVVAVAWLAVTGFSIPVAMLEEKRDESWFDRLGRSLTRSLELARIEYLHALGVSAALVLLFLLLGFYLGAALGGLADVSSTVAAVLVRLVLAPLFFFGFAVLYYDQRSRILARPTGEGREDAQVPDAVDAERAGPSDVASEPGARRRGEQGR
jgi:small-conductance mechanosensitive channel